MTRSLPLMAGRASPPWTGVAMLKGAVGGMGESAGTALSRCARHRGAWLFEKLPWLAPGWDDRETNEKKWVLSIAMTPVMGSFKNASGCDAQVPTLSEAAASLPLHFIIVRQLRPVCRWCSFMAPAAQP